MAKNRQLLDPDKIYDRFQIVSRNPLFRLYLRWAYSQGIKDIEKTGNGLNFRKKNFTALLCGTSGEITTEEFIKFILGNNTKANIVVLDIGQKQINAINDLIKSKYRGFNITTLKINALELCKYIRCRSVDLIETDGFLEYFSPDDLVRLLTARKKVLAPSGFIVTRAPVVRNKFDGLLYKGAMWVMTNLMGTDVYRYSDSGLRDIFRKTGFSCVEGRTPLFFVLRRYVLFPKWGKSRQIWYNSKRRGTQNFVRPLF